MERTFKDLILSLFPLSKNHKLTISKLSNDLKPEQIKDIKYLLKTKKIGIVTTPTRISKELAHFSAYTQFQIMIENPQVQTFINDINHQVKESSQRNSYHSFSKHAYERLVRYIAPNILGLAEIKESVLLLLFSKERFHILLVGDPGTGKTDIIRSAQRLAPISSFGLGSGTSGAGLSVSMKGKELELGLLPLAHQGICCIDELNLMQVRDRAALYSAMEKGFVTYDKKGMHKQIPAEIRILATANPVGDKFVGRSLSVLKEQLPFDAALLSRFHLSYVIREPDAHKLATIAKKIVKSDSIKLREEDLEYIKGYIEYSLKQDVEFDKRYAQLISDFIEDVKTNESKYVVEIGPRLVHGIMRLAQARARIELRDKTTKEDVLEAIRLVKDSLYIEDIVRP
ncbi:ATP-binding protein [Candidatus Woesearchaeota archaeon]|nr:ATP-binding protein [Candidatus Woesearchaeota archaeon]